MEPLDVHVILRPPEEGCRIIFAVAWSSAGYVRSAPAGDARPGSSPALQHLRLGAASSARLRHIPGFSSSGDGCLRVCRHGRQCGLTGVEP